MELKDLVGLHFLTGVDFENFETGGYYNWDAQVVNFVLDGITYTATEDPEDGYRSCMREIKVSDFRVTNIFPAIQVLGVMRRREFSSYDSDIIDFYDTKNGKPVLSVGTDNLDNYYPSFVSDFQPENMSINNGRS